jgi:hypothetical protein
MEKSEKIVLGLVSKLEKLKVIFKKINSESILNYLKKSPNICDKYEERLQIYNFFVIKYLIVKEKNQKKKLKNVKKIESSSEYNDLLDNCLIHKFKEIEKILKKYNKNIKKLIETMIKMVKIYEKLEKYKNNFNEKTIKMGYLTSKILQNSIISLTEKDKLFNEFMKKNKKAFDELKNNDKKAYITFFVVRYPLEYFVLP